MRQFPISAAILTATTYTRPAWPARAATSIQHPRENTHRAKETAHKATDSSSMACYHTPVQTDCRVHASREPWGRDLQPHINEELSYDLKAKIGNAHEPR